MTLYITMFGLPDRVQRIDNVKSIDKMESGNLVILIDVDHPSGIKDVEVILHEVVTCEVN